MIKNDKIGAARLRTLLMSLGIVACLGGVAYSFFVIQREAGQEGQYRMIADELGSLARQVNISAARTAQGQQAAFTQLASEVSRFEQPERSDHKAWAHPVVANGKLYLRDQGLLLCYDISAK